MAGGIVGWQFFDVESGQLPEETAPSILPGGGEGRIVVLAATPFAQKDNWAARATVAIARDWSEQGLSVFLMDLGLEAPSLHQVLELPNDEGVSDAFLYGASVQHIAKPALDEAIFFASAGTAASDPEEVLGHPRWNDLAGGFSEADATLLLYLPTDIPGAGKILSRASDIVFLAAQGESEDTHLGPASIKVVSMIGPLGSPPEEIPEEALAPEPAGVVDGSEDLGLGGETLEEPPAEAEEEDTGFDFGGGLELADGFGEVALDEEPPEEGVPDEDEASGEDALDFGVALEPAAEVGGEGEEEETHDLGIGDDFTGELEVEGSAIVEEDMPGEGPPDFGADFVDLPSDDEGGGDFAPAGVEEEGEFGGDLVQGPDFGGPGPDEAGVGVEAGIPSDTQEASRESEEAPAGEEEAPRPPPKRRAPPKKKKPVGLYATLIIVLAAVAAVGGTAFGFLNIPGLTVLQEYTGSIPEPALTLEGAQLTGTPMRYSLVLFDDYGETDLAQAQEMMGALEDARSDLLFFLVPEAVEGTLTYFLMAGPAATPLDAENLRGPLGEVLSREDPSAWEVRETPRAFYLGRFPTLDEARSDLSTIEADGIDAYILQSTLDDGTEAYVIFSGGFMGAEDALRLQILLRRSGFPEAPLIERRGVFPG